jgi:hypothetical protein
MTCSETPGRHRGAAGPAYGRKEITIPNGSYLSLKLANKEAEQCATKVVIFSEIPDGKGAMKASSGRVRLRASL